MPEYSVTVQAQSNSAPSTEDTFVELSVNPLKIKYVFVRLGNGQQSAGVDNDYMVRLFRKTAAGATGVSYTPVRAKQSDRLSGATCTIKNGASAFNLATQGDTVGIFVKNGRETFEWVARDEIDYIEVHPTLGSGGMFALSIASSVGSQQFTVVVKWEE